MKKTFIHTWLPTLLLAFATIGFTACSSDDDDPTGGTSGGNDKAIDLGLPSGTKWASCNVGATNPWESGNYYAWGETESKECYNEDTAIHYDKYKGIHKYLGDEISGTEYDAATAELGDDWRMPTLDEYHELHKNCTWEWTTRNQVNGYNVTGPNGNSIFLPAAGAGQNSSISYYNEHGYYWLSTLNINDDEQRAYSIMLRDGARGSNSGNRVAGFTVRAVTGTPAPNQPQEPTEPGKPIEPEEPEYQAIDLGLSVKWASCNVGAKNPWEYGAYYAWGEHKEKETYTAQNYTGPTNRESISGSAFDAASWELGLPWRMPTQNEFVELINNCTLEITKMNGVNVGKFTSKKNGNSIILPVAGWKLDRSYKVGEEAGYWAGTGGGKQGLLFLGSGSNVFFKPYTNWTATTGMPIRAVIE